MSECLITRLEIAAGPDQNLDADIEAFVAGGIPAYRAKESWMRSYSANFIHGDETGQCHPLSRHAPTYTASIDAALMLVPGHHRVDVQRTGDDGYACVWGDAGNRSVRAATPSIALCIAALKTRVA